MKQPNNYCQHPATGKTWNFVTGVAVQINGAAMLCVCVNAYNRLYFASVNLHSGILQKNTRNPLWMWEVCVGEFWPSKEAIVCCRCVLSTTGKQIKNSTERTVCILCTVLDICALGMLNASNPSVNGVICRFLARLTSQSGTLSMCFWLAVIRSLPFRRCISFVESFMRHVFVGLWC